MKHPLIISQGLIVWMMGKSNLHSRLLNDGVAVCSVSSVPLALSEDSLILPLCLSGSVFSSANALLCPS